MAYFEQNPQNQATPSLAVSISRQGLTVRGEQPLFDNPGAKAVRAVSPGNSLSVSID